MKARILALICLMSFSIASGTISIAEAQQPVIVQLSLPPGPPPSVNETFYVDIQITASSKIEVYAWGVELKFQPYAQVIPINVTEGSFLPSAGPTFFAYRVDVFGGSIDIANTLLTPPCTGGASCVPPMPNLLARVYFKCIAPGLTSMELDGHAFIDCGYNPIPCNAACRRLDALLEA